jgi:glycosyltransferase involved in cell wall biosynthesis
MSARDASLPDLHGVRVAVVNPYLEGRELDCARGLYPRSHLWGADALTRAGALVEFIRPVEDSRWLRRVSRATKGRLGELDFDLTLARRAAGFDVLYAPAGRFLITQALRALGAIRAPLIYWNYVPPSRAPWWKLRDWWERWPLSRGIDALLCLTQLAEDSARARWPWLATRRVDWGADATMFPGSESEGEYFFACGRTNRDYTTLLAAAERVPVPLVILVSRRHLDGLRIPPNVRVVEGPPDASTDKGVPYAQLIELYARARAVLICRLDLASDTSGFTNLLEALAMSRPTAITRTGALDLDVEKEGVGRLVAPGDVDGWAEVLREWSADSPALRAMRSRARRLVEEHYSHERHGRDVAWFIRDLLDGRTEKKGGAAT